MANQKKLIYPTKQTVNLAREEVTMSSPKRAIPLFLVFMALVVLFSKYGVADQLVRAGQASAGLSEAQKQLDTLKAYTADYDDVKARYDLATYQYMTDEEKKTLDRLNVLTMLHDQVMSQSTLSSITITGNECHIVISSVQLGAIAELVSALQENPNVQYINVSTADTEKQKEAQGNKNVTANLTIVLADPTQQTAGTADNKNGTANAGTANAGTAKAGAGSAGNTTVTSEGTGAAGGTTNAETAAGTDAAAGTNNAAAAGETNAAATNGAAAAETSAAGAAGNATSAAAGAGTQNGGGV